MLLIHYNNPMKRTYSEIEKKISFCPRTFEGRKEKRLARHTIELKA